MTTTADETSSRALTARKMLNKVPEVTLYFWVIKVLCTTVGETASDYLATNLNLGLTKTTFITGAVLLVTLFFQFRLRRYVAGVYWLGIVLISVVGTQITDNLTDNFGVSLVTTTIVFSIVLAIVFAIWYASEGTLSIHTIYTTRREAFYWLAVLFTFALGTAAGDLTAERLNVGYAWSLVIFAAAIALVTGLHYRFKLNAVLAFWIAYILTRPLGASTGDLLSQDRSVGGLGLGTTVTSIIFLVAILTVVTFLTITRRDVTEIVAHQPNAQAQVLVVAHRTAATPALLDAIRSRAARGAASFHLLVPNPSEHAEITDAERQRRHEDGEHVLALALPLIEQAAGLPTDGTVSVRHDPLDAIEEIVHDGDFHEIIISTLPQHVSRWLHSDLPRRAEHLGLPVTTVTAVGRA
ncbi:MAG: hypothetical protein QOF75_1666 [Gaiellaceae bacterium]|jgi:uncharacterized membrane-anchored protein|nr:hypothetical protein [Gaiellaceae bacterium]MDX6473548.1 hypothetical protein [Gaiellaceae bacterium]